MLTRDQPPAGAVPPCLSWRNITMRDIRILNPRQSPGVIIGAQANPVRCSKAWSLASDVTREHSKPHLSLEAAWYT